MYLQQCARVRIVRAPEAYRGLARTHTSSEVLHAKERDEQIIESGFTEERVVEVRIPQASATPAARKASAILRARTAASSNARVRGTRNALNDRLCVCVCVYQRQAIHELQEANRAIEQEIKDMHTKLVEMGVSPSPLCDSAYPRAHSRTHI